MVGGAAQSEFGVVRIVGAGLQAIPATENGGGPDRLQAGSYKWRIL
jgi:hypothetical protein